MLALIRTALSRSVFRDTIRAALLLVLVTMQPAVIATAQVDIVFDPGSMTCSGVPGEPEVPASWQTAISNDRPSVGETVTIGLRDKFGERGSELFSLILLGPDRQPIDLIDGTTIG